MAGYSDIIGHEQIKEHLINAVAADKVNHAYIFNGPEGSGKKMLAEAFAMALQCEKGGPEPCLNCRSCRQAMNGNHPDIIYVTHEKPKTISVNDIREMNRNVQIKPYSSRYKVFLVDEAEKMNAQAQNALLKTIEEPPAYAVILLLTTKSDAMLPTILSRSITLNLKAVSNDAIREHLMKNYGVPDYKADTCVAFAQGNVGKAIRLAGSSDFSNLKDSVVDLMKRIDGTDLYELESSADQMMEHKLDISDYFDLMMVWFRDVLYLKTTNDINGIVFKDEAHEIKKQASKHSYQGLEKILEALDKARIRCEANVSRKLVLELLLLTIKEN
ncbi:MAG: DNA polymerase III subunit delta' [Clostridiales bacterium]|nr:DNA polymerase III subunit delta' [Clostridiales bacterium]